MIAAFNRFFSLPEDRDPAFIRLVRNILIFTLVSTLVSFVVVATTSSSAGLVITLITLGVIAALDLAALVLAFRGRIAMAKVVVPLALVVAITIIALSANSIHDISIVAYPLIVVIATLLQGRRAFLVTTPLVAVAIALLGVLDMLGMTRSVIAYRTGIDDILIGVILILSAGGILNLLVGRLTQALTRAESNEQAQISANLELRELKESLEQRVEQRTRELDRTTRQNEKRAQDLQTVAEIARYISIEKDLEKLLALITRIVSDRFGFYHVGIFLLDETRRYAVLRASNSSGGQAMLRRMHRLEVGGMGIVGYVTGSGSPRIALDTGADATYFNNPNLPDTRSEMALPLTSSGAIIGALDVQSTVPNAFQESDVSILSLLADQIAIAIENARLIEEAQSAAAEARAIFSEYIAESWQKKTNSTVLGYHQSLAGGRIITGEAGAPAVVAGKNVLEIPIRVRDQVIGMMNIQPVEPDAALGKDDINVIEAVAERLGLALDNARLFEETSSRATRERLVSDITSRIRSTNDPQAMIETAMEELRRALGVTRVEIIPQTAPAASGPTGKAERSGSHDENHRNI